MRDLRRDNATRSRGHVEIDTDECKGCGLCVEACPPIVLHLGRELNHFGYLTASYDGAGCSGCGICFYVCPEPGAVTVYAKMDDRPRDSVNPIAPWRALALECG